MSKLLEEAIEVAQSLPDEEQDAAGNLLLWYLANEERQGRETDRES